MLGVMMAVTIVLTKVLTHNNLFNNTNDNNFKMQINKNLSKHPLNFLYREKNLNFLLKLISLLTIVIHPIEKKKTSNFNIVGIQFFISILQLFLNILQLFSIQSMIDYHFVLNYNYF